MEERWHFVYETYPISNILFLDHFLILLSQSIATMIDVLKYLKGYQMEEKTNLFSATFENRKMYSYNKVRTF